MSKNTKFYICSHCGNLVEAVHESGVSMMCCGQKMTELVPGTVELLAQLVEQLTLNQWVQGSSP